MNVSFIYILWILLCYRYTVTEPDVPIGKTANSPDVSFEILNAGFKVVGRFEKAGCDVVFYPDDLERSNIVGYAEAGSINTGITLRDEHLRSSEYFDVTAHPNIKLVSRSFRQNGKGKFTGTFELTIKEHKRILYIPFTVSLGNHVELYKGSFTVNRLDFGIGQSSPILKDEVTVLFRVKCIKN